MGTKDALVNHIANKDNLKFSDDTRIAGTTWKELKKSALKDNYHLNSWFVSSPRLKSVFTYFYNFDLLLLLIDRTRHR